MNQLAKKYKCHTRVIEKGLKERGISIRNRSEQRVFTYGVKPVCEWKQLYDSGLSTYEIARKYKTSQSVVCDSLVKAGHKLRKGNQKYDLPWDEIKRKYQDQHTLPSVNMLARQYGCESTIIRDYFKKKEIPIRSGVKQSNIDRLKGRRRYCSVNEHFFDEWSDDMAYVLGWIYSDGSIKKNLRGFQITSTDIEHLQNIAAMMGDDVGISFYKGKRNKKVAAKLSINREHMVAKLIELGLTPNKTKTMTFPLVPARYLSSFVRGYFEGDGYVGVDRKKRVNPRIRVTFTSSSLSFLEQLNNMLEKEIDVHGKLIINKTTQVWTLYILKREMVEKLFLFMYKGTNERNRLYRKWVVFENYFNRKEDEFNWVNMEHQLHLN